MSTETAPTILVVDDTQQNVQVLSQMLRDQKYKVLAAFNGTDALELVKRRKPDLILMDVMMPGMDGFETCARLRAQPEYNDVPVIFLSALNDVEAKVRAFEMGGADYITKPFHQQEVLARLAHHLRLKQLEAEQMRAIESLRRLNQEKDEILGIVSHDMRNPIGGIIGIANFLQTDTIEDPDEMRQMLALIEQSAERLLALVNDLLDVTVIESGTVQLNIVPTDLGQAIAEVLHLHTVTAKNKGVDLLLEVPEPVVAQVDPLRFPQIIGNLVSNAVKFTPAGKKVVIRVRKCEGQACVEVEDEGIGMSPDMIPDLFRKFSHQRRGTDGEKGTGLGMALIKQYVDAHGGTIHVDSLTGRGTRFEVRFSLT